MRDDGRVEAIRLGAWRAPGRGAARRAQAIRAACLSVMLCLSATPLHAFDFDDVIDRARMASEAPPQSSGRDIPEFLMTMSYDQWRDIRFRKEESLWHGEGLPYTIEFFHPGLFYDRPVAIHAVNDGRVAPVEFSKRLFTYGKNDVYDRIPEHLGFAGLRAHHPLNRASYYDEVAVFLGASYFRAVGRGLQYGISARGLAIDTARETGEAFPYFTAFWLVRPSVTEQWLVIYALLESASVTGAYQFTILPGDATKMDVDAYIFRRAADKKIGIAPLTSMYFYSQISNRRPIDDFRPEVHDSDGLLLAYPSGEYVWRPLANQAKLSINAFHMPRLEGFGLLQRDTDFDHYLDAEARYEKRPSVWVEPLGDWGPGKVELIQIPTDSEKNDNIVAYWTPDTAADDTWPMHFQYRLTWYAFDRHRIHGGGFVQASRTSAGRDNDHRKILLDFKGGTLADLPPTVPVDAPLEAVIEVDDTAEVIERQLYRIPGARWRLVFEVKRRNKSTLEDLLPSRSASTTEIRAYLQQAEDVKTETWSHAIRWQD